MSSKQKLNTDNSAMAELVVVGQLLPLVMWVPLFSEEQGNPTETNSVCQDNNSTILLEKKRKVSSSERTCAIKMQYFMVTDLVKKGQLDIVHCPTDNMTGDFSQRHCRILV